MRQRFVRKIVVRLARTHSTDLRCSECAWRYTIHHLSEIVDEIEEHQATQLYTAHICAGFPGRPYPYGTAGCKAEHRKRTSAKYVVGCQEAPRRLNEH